MTLPEEILLGPEEEARRLWEGSLAAHERATDDLVSLCESLDLGIRAAEILVVRKLQPVREKFPATIGVQLESPDPEVDVERDASAPPKTLQFVDLVDLLSEEESECASPRLHRGWEDRRFSCRRSRKTAQAAVGLCLDDASRERLMQLAAYRNRIFRDPPPVRIRPGEILRGFESLCKVVESLLSS